jgi:DNA-binding transcriptional LysR family regulator
MISIRKIWVMRRLSLDHLHTFADVVELGSFSAAARRLNLTQPAVSLHIKQLEARLGVRLIERIGRRAHPTAAGRDLIGHVQRVDAAVAGALDAVADHRDGGAAGGCGSAPAPPPASTCCRRCCARCGRNSRRSRSW